MDKAFPTSPDPSTPIFMVASFSDWSKLPASILPCCDISDKYIQISRVLSTRKVGARCMRTKTYNCPVEAAIDVVGGKWKAVILWWLQQRTWRFAELRRKIPG